VLNVSRTQIKKVLAVYGDEHEVYVLNITASPHVLRRRLVLRSRENAADIETRLARALQNVPSGPHVITVKNEASIDVGAARVVDALKGRLKYSLWLVPPDNSQMALWSRVVIAGLAQELNERSGNAGLFATFPPHVTLCPSFVATQREAVAKAQAVVQSLPPISLRLAGEACNSDLFFQAITLNLDVGPEGNNEFEHASTVRASAVTKYQYSKK
jgi:hypothetical protein